MLSLGLVLLLKWWLFSVGLVDVALVVGVVADVIVGDGVAIAIVGLRQ